MVQSTHFDGLMPVCRFLPCSVCFEIHLDGSFFLGILCGFLPFRFFTCLMWVHTSWGHDQFSRIGKVDTRHYGENHSCVHYFDLVSYC